MTEIRADSIISFQEIEASVWESVVNSFRETMVEILEGLDRALYEARDPKRLVLKEMRETHLVTKVGLIAFKRRYYWDADEERWVFPLDESLGVEKRQRVSNAVRAEAVEAAVAGSSYRGAAAELERRDCQVAVSHEAIRQWTLKAGEAIKAEAQRQQDNPAGERRVPVLFIEADGFWPGRQRSKRQETKLFVVHEGWEPRTPGSQEYRLINRREFIPDPKGDAWEQCSAWVESEWDLSDTWVVINGDRAPWIRKGVEWFHKAMYQVDRFHLIREIRRLLGGHPEALAQAEAAIGASDAEGLLRALKAATAAEEDPKRRADLRRLLADLGSMPESTRDYRVRLQEKGVNTEGLRGVGSAESAVERYSQRLRKCGRSWSDRGLQAMLHAMTAYFRGTLRGVVEVMEQLLGLEPLTKTKQTARRAAAESVGRKLDAARHAHLPALDYGTTASGGLSKTFRSIVNG